MSSRVLGETCTDVSKCAWHLGKRVKYWPCLVWAPSLLRVVHLGPQEASLSLTRGLHGREFSLVPCCVRGIPRSPSSHCNMTRLTLWEFRWEISTRVTWPVRPPLCSAEFSGKSHVYCRGPESLSICTVGSQKQDGIGYSDGKTVTWGQLSVHLQVGIMGWTNTCLEVDIWVLVKNWLNFPFIKNLKSFHKCNVGKMSNKVSFIETLF